MEYEHFHPEVTRASFMEVNPSESFLFPSTWASTMVTNCRHCLASLKLFQNLFSCYFPLFMHMLTHSFNKLNFEDLNGFRRQRHSQHHHYHNNLVRVCQRAQGGIKTPLPPKKKSNAINPECGKSCEEDKSSLFCIPIIWMPSQTWSPRKSSKEK